MLWLQDASIEKFLISICELSMNIRDLEAFIAVVETGSIVAASARLSLTQPGVSRRIQNLEDRLDAVLLDRQSKPLRPTPAGRAAYEHGRQVLRSLDDLRAGVSPDGETRGEFRLGISPCLSETALASPLDRLRAEFPLLTIRIVSGWSASLTERLSRNELDAATLCLADGVAPPGDLVSEDLGTQSVLLVAAPALGVPKAPMLPDLAHFPWVMNDTSCGFRAFIRHTFESARLPFHVAVEALSSDLRMSLVARGVGIGVVTPAAFAASPWQGAVQIIDSPEFRPQMRAWLLHRPSTGRLYRPIEVLRSALLEALAEPPLAQE